MPLDGAPIVRKFTDGSDNLLDLWSDERHTLIASNLTDAQNIGDPLLDSGSMMPGDPAYLGYMPLASVPPLIGTPYSGAVVGGGSYGYSPYSYSPYGIYSPNSPFMIYGGLYAPVYLNRLRPSGVIGIRPGVGAIGGGTSIRTFTPHPAAGPRPGVGRVGGHR